MYILPLTVIIAVALAITLARNGIGSFMTLGIIGAAVYTIPALIDMQVAIGSRATGSQVSYILVPTDVEFVVFIAWLALLASLIACVFVFPMEKFRKDFVFHDERMRSVAFACAIVGPLGLAYFAYSQDSLLFFLQERDKQDIGGFETLWRWIPVIGLVAGSLARDRRLLIFNGFLLFIIFIRGDRTLVAIVTAALVVAASYKDPKWWRRLAPSQIAGFTFAAGVIFLGKSIYIIIKTTIAGGSTDRLTAPISVQLLYQFEPLATFAHLEFVMRTGLRIPVAAFVESIIGNLLLIPSFFGVSTNLYNATVTSHLSAKLSSGIAGNYLAHGYSVGGLPMAAFFYFMMPLMLRLCDGQFRKRAGVVKVFWCCVGAVIAFYVHRNGLDNLFSFVRQIFIVCAVIAGVALAMRHQGLAASPAVRLPAAPRGAFRGAVPRHLPTPAPVEGPQGTSGT